MPLRRAIAEVINDRDLDIDVAEEAMNIIMDGEATPAQIGCFLTALRMKGETFEGIARKLAISNGAAKMRYRRILSYLKEKARVQDATILNVTHKEIATELSSSREAISRLLKQLENMGHIKLHRNRIELVDLVDVQ